MSLPVFNQWYGTWSGINLGDSPYRCADSGCYSCSITMILSNFGFKLDPKQFIEKMNATGGYTDGAINYGAVEKAYPGVFFHKRVDTTNHPAHNISKVEIGAAIKQVQKLVGIGMYPIMCVDNILNDKWPDHAVVCIEAPDDLTQWKIINPDGGKVQNFQDKYGPVEQNLYGYVAFIGSPLSATKDIDTGIGVWKAKTIERAIVRGDYPLAKTLGRELVDSFL